MKWLRNKFNYVKRLFSKWEGAAINSQKCAESCTEAEDSSEIVQDSEGNQVTNAEGIALICKFEGYYPMPYLCPANVPTIGYGTTIYPSGKGVQLSDAPISEKTAREYLAHDLKNEEDRLNRFIKKRGLDLNSNQFSALISFAYNLGFGAIVSASSTVYKGLVNRDHDLVCYGMSLYVKAGGKTLKGLVRRRQAEINLYKTLI